MLFVGLVDNDGERAARAAMLVELGAVCGRPDAPPPWNPGGQSIVVFEDATWPGLHLVIAGKSLDDAMPLAAADASCASVGAGSVAALWTDRLVPFEANLREGRRAPRRQQAILADPDPTWPQQAARLMERFRFSTDDEFIRIDHIGSTSVPGLHAKQLIDIQIVVPDLAIAGRVAQSARRAGFVHVPGQWFGTDRHGADHPEEVVVDADPGRPVNLNIRPATAPVWRETLLLRDWLRCHDDERDSYAAMKQQLARRPGLDVNYYSEDKMPWISAALGRAEAWALSSSWASAG